MAPKCAKKISPHHYTTSSLNRWDKAGWIHAFMFFTPNSDPTSECRSRNQDSSDQTTFFNLLLSSFGEACGNCILRVLFLSDRSGTRCGLLLLEPICFRVRRVVCSEMVFCIPFVTSGYLSYCCLSIISNQSVHSPLTSKRHLSLFQTILCKH